MTKRLFRIAVAGLVAVMLFEFWYIGQKPETAASRASTASVDRASQFGMTAGQYDELLTKNKSNGISKESTDIGLALVPRVRELCGLPVGHRDRPNDALCTQR
jgi:hypothetical protein